MSDLTTTDKKPKRLKPKQRATLENWLKPDSETYGNLYQSCIKAGFRPSYALNISHLRPNWLSESIESIDFNHQHIKAGIQQLATQTTDPVDSRSPADTRLKAYEILAKITGMIDSKTNTTNVIVQPILGGQSQTPPKIKIDNTVIDQ